MIETSINIGYDRKAQLTLVADTLNIPTSVILSHLVRKSRKLFTNKAKLFQTIQYQERRESGYYEIMNVSFFDCDHEYVGGESKKSAFCVLQRDNVLLE